MLTDFPVFGEQPHHFRYEIVRDFEDHLMVWDNDEAVMVPGSRCTYLDKLRAFHALDRCQHVARPAWTANDWGRRPV
jgi:hypothetical protein